MQLTKQLMNEWISFLYNRNYSENTIQNYSSDMKLFTDYLKLEKWVYTIDENEITMRNIERWKTYLSKIPAPKTSIYYTKWTTLSPQTIQGKIVSIKSFLKFLNIIYEKWLDYKKIETKKIKSDYIECITETEWQLFFNFIWNYEKYKINALRMQLLCNIGYTSGLRLSEALWLTVDQIKNRETRITWKGKKTRWVFFTWSTEKLLENYLEEREKPIPRTWKTEKPSDFVFISHNSGYDYGKPIKKNTVCEILKKYSDSLAIGKRITMHSLRHSYATKLLESGLNIREIQELLWHCDIQTTENYCHVLRSNLAKKVNQIFY
jgi:integrase/recombinase XerD